MAERGDRPSISDGSDADIIFTCSPCNELGTREEAAKYCPECDEYLCKTCTKYHLKMKATRDHKLAEREEKHEANVAKTTGKIKCQQHPDRDIEMYCGRHDMVYCLMCIATDHRFCSDVTNLTDAAGMVFQQNEIDHLQDESESVKKLLADTEKKIHDNIASVEKTRNKIQNRVTEIEEGLIEHIKTLSKKANVNLNEKYSKVKDKLESEASVLACKISQMDSVKEQLNPTNYAQPEHHFAHVKLSQQMINVAKILNAKFESISHITIQFAENTNLPGQVLDVTTFGEINETRVNGKTEIKRQEEINVKLKSDKTICDITDICQLDSGCCILADYNNLKVKLLDMNSQKVTKHFDVGAAPLGICRTGYNEVAVKLQSNKVDLLSVGASFSKTRSIPIKRGGDFWGIAYAARRFFVAKGMEVDVYDTDGTLTTKVARDSVGQKIFKSAIRQMTSHENAVFVADCSDGIVCLACDGRKKSKFRDNKLSKTVGVCVSCDGIIYAFDEVSGKIVMFSKNGNCSGELVPEISSGKSPELLCYDNKNNCILIGYAASDTVTVLHLCDQVTE